MALPQPGELLRHEPVLVDLDFLDRLVPLVYQALRRLAADRLQGEGAGHTLQPTALVNEVYLRLSGRESMEWNDKAHFFAAAADAMRRVLIDHARAKRRLKRGGGRVRLPLDAVDLIARGDPSELLSVDLAVQRLEERDERLAQVVKLRFFAGLSESDTAHALGVTDRTVRRDWVLARAFLQKELNAE